MIARLRSTSSDVVAGIGVGERVCAIVARAAKMHKHKGFTAKLHECGAGVAQTEFDGLRDAELHGDVDEDFARTAGEKGLSRRRGREEANINRWVLMI